MARTWRRIATSSPADGETADQVVEAVGDQDQIAHWLVPGDRLVAVVPLEELFEDEEDDEAPRQTGV